MTAALIAAFIYVTKTTTATTVLWWGNLPLSLFCFAVWAALFRYVVSLLTRRTAKKAMWLIVGSEDLAQKLVRDYERTVLPGDFTVINETEAPLESLQIAEDEQHSITVIGGEEVIYAGAVSGNVLASESYIPDGLTSQLMRIRLKGIPIMESSDFYEHNLLRVPVLQLKAHWFAFAEGFSLLHRDVELKLKRLSIC